MSHPTTPTSPTTIKSWVIRTVVCVIAGTFVLALLWVTGTHLIGDDAKENPVRRPATVQVEGSDGPQDRGSVNQGTGSVNPFAGLPVQPFGSFSPGRTIWDEAAARAVAAGAVDPASAEEATDAYVDMLRRLNPGVNLDKVGAHQTLWLNVE